jgi:hypothetical protein
MYIGIMAFNGHATKLPPTAAANAAAGIAFSSCARSVSGSTCGCSDALEVLERDFGLVCSGHFGSDSTSA